MNPELLLDQIKKSANIRKTRNLEIVNDVCREQFERGSKDFSIALIGRLSEQKGGPATQSIHNKTGADFKALISAWASHTGGSVKRQPKLKDNPLYTIMEKIPDPAVRAVVGSVLAENKKLKGEVNLLKRNAGVIIDQRPSQRTPVYAQQLVEILPDFHGLTDSEKDALRHSVSDKLMRDEGWNIDDSGRIMNKLGRPIFKAGYASAIRKVLGCIDGD